MEAVRRQRAPGALPEAPTLDDEIEYLWLIWRDLNAARGAGGMAPNPLSYVEIEAYCRLTDEHLEPWEVQAIRAVDNVFMAGLAAAKEGDAANG